MIETCCVMDQFCTSPANLFPPVRAGGHCFACGQAVCTECSSIRSYYGYGRVRLCNNCQVDYDGDDHRVMARLCRKAGYK